MPQCRATYAGLHSMAVSKPALHSLSAPFAPASETAIQCYMSNALISTTLLMETKSGHRRLAAELTVTSISRPQFFAKEQMLFVNAMQFKGQTTFCPIPTLRLPSTCFGSDEVHSD